MYLLFFLHLLIACLFDIQVVKVKPNDKDAKMKYSECSKIVKQKAFEKAIACNDHEKKPISETLNLDTISMKSVIFLFAG